MSLASATTTGKSLGNTFYGCYDSFFYERTAYYGMNEWLYPKTQRRWAEFMLNRLEPTCCGIPDAYGLSLTT